MNWNFPTTSSIIKLMREKPIKDSIFFISIILMFFAACYLFRFLGIWDFLGEVENKTFVLRQQVISKYKHHTKDIVILTVGDPGYV